jgi:hypothetical protein
LRVQFRNEQFFRRARPHKGFRRDVLNVRRSRKPAENAARREKGHLWMDNKYIAVQTYIAGLFLNSFS